MRRNAIDADKVPRDGIVASADDINPVLAVSGYDVSPLNLVRIRSRGADARRQRGGTARQGIDPADHRVGNGGKGRNQVPQLNAIPGISHNPRSGVIHPDVIGPHLGSGGSVHNLDAGGGIAGNDIVLNHRITGLINGDTASEFDSRPIRIVAVGDGGDVTGIGTESIGTGPDPVVYDLIRGTALEGDSPAGIAGDNVPGMIRPRLIIPNPVHGSPVLNADSILIWNGSGPGWVGSNQIPPNIIPGGVGTGNHQARHTVARNHVILQPSGSEDAADLYSIRAGADADPAGIRSDGDPSCVRCRSSVPIDSDKAPLHLRVVAVQDNSRAAEPNHDQRTNRAVGTIKNQTVARNRTPVDLNGWGDAVCGELVMAGKGDRLGNDRKRLCQADHEFPIRVGLIGWNIEANLIPRGTLIDGRDCMPK